MVRFISPSYWFRHPFHVLGLTTFVLSICSCGPQTIPANSPQPSQHAGSSQIGTSTPSSYPTVRLAPNIVRAIEAQWSPTPNALWLTSTPEPTLKPGASCPVSPTEEKYPMIGVVSGKSPLWVVNFGTIAWDKIGPNVISPFQGKLGKQLWVVEAPAKGDLVIRGERLNDGKPLLFPSSGTDLERVDDTHLRVAVQPLPYQYIANAESGEKLSPPGVQWQGTLLIYPSPGCYMITGTLHGASKTYHVQVVQLIRP